MPSVLAHLEWATAIDLCYHIRSGSVDEALGVIGAWGQLHADVEPEFSMYFAGTNGHPYRDFAVISVWHYPPYFQRLREEFLVTPDGRCSLPIAYVLAYGYLVQDRMQEWIDFLDAQLSDPQLTGDRRVNWLIARARSAEIATGTPQRHRVGRERMLVGREWLEEATLVTSSPTTKLRALKEIAARLASVEEIDAAQQLIDEKAKDLGGGTTAIVSAWEEGLRDLAQQFVDDRIRQKQEALSAAREVYQRRMQKAIGLSGEIDISRYEQRLESIDGRLERE